MPLDPDIAMLVTEIDVNLSHAESIAYGLTREQFPLVDRRMFRAPQRHQ